MEAFSLLKYWRGGGVGGGGGGGAGGGAADVCVNVRPTTGTTTIVTAVAHNNGETDDDDGDDDGPFFDLEFAVPDEDEEEAEEGQNRKPIRGSDSDEEEENDDYDDDEEDEEDEDCDGVEVEGEREFGFTLSSGCSNDRADPNLSLSPSDDLFFKGKLVPIESSSLVFNPSEPNSKPQFRVSLLKSATKFRVFMLGFKKSRMNGSEKTDSKTEPKTESKTETKAETNGSVACASKQHQNEPQQQKKTEKQEEQQRQKQHQSKFFTVKFKVEEVPIMSLFTRDNSSRNSSASNKSQKQQNPDESSSEEKRFTKEVMQKYLKMVKPLYVRVSKRYGEKLRFSGQLSLNSSVAKGSPVPATATQKSITAKPLADKSQPEAEVSEASPSNVKNQKQGNLPAGLRVVCKHLGKSRSASSAVAAVPPGTVQSRRRDDSLLQQQDGIQSAILHCKRSFNASRDSESSLLPRSVSDPTNEKSLDMSRTSSKEGKDGDHQRP
ncbi:hypothetical protein FEM48_Zijuj11G0026900 [Ziziphus jujuba var. spinosa]|uniref:Membrane-associated kinase regulator 2 n=1 Tax=Ziziphus jujuba var. spinosa TaxID=714518 RepID=A0A978UGC6_ZIZJJ|nr:hypothetical protein FEM48_Zijuj11G0026900 [Ziziphus jujuba var. spinosa]